MSTPVSWDEVARGVAIDDFRIDNVPARIAALGDLWAPVCAQEVDGDGRFKLDTLLGG